MQKINIISILRDHWETMRDAKSKRIGFGNIILFFVLPVIISLSLVFYLEVRVGKDLLNRLVAVKEKS